MEIAQNMIQIDKKIPKVSVLCPCGIQRERAMFQSLKQLTIIVNSLVNVKKVND
jgi:hypothetical protein